MFVIFYNNGTTNQMLNSTSIVESNDLEDYSLETTIPNDAVNISIRYTLSAGGDLTNLYVDDICLSIQ